MASVLIDTQWPDEVPDRVQSGIRTLAQLSADEASTVLRFAPSYEKAYVGRVQQEVADEAAERAGMEHRAAHTALAAATYLAKAFADGPATHDSPEDVADALYEREFIPEESVPRLIQVLRHIREEIAPEVFYEQRKFDAASSGAPILQQWNMQTNYRPVLRDGYKIYSDVDDYQPELLGVVPVVTARMTVGQENQHTISFQFPRDQLDSMIAQLESLKKEFEEADEYLSLEDL